MLMAHLSCTYLCTNKGIGSFPNEINEEVNPELNRDSIYIPKRRMELNNGNKRWKARKFWVAIKQLKAWLSEPTQVVTIAHAYKLLLHA
jgi:hypothetical protein